VILILVGLVFDATSLILLQSDSLSVPLAHVTAIRPLARSIYRSCETSSTAFRQICSELASLIAVLEVTDEDVRKEYTSGEYQPIEHETQLIRIAGGCRAVLTDIRELITQYNELPQQTQLSWDRIEWVREQISDLRGRLVTNVTMLTAFNAGVTRYAEFFLSYL
jgi:hypothetical protein